MMKDDLLARVRELGSATWKGCEWVASGGSNTLHWIRNNILDFQRAMSVKTTVENGKVCKKRRW